MASFFEYGLFRLCGVLLLALLGACAASGPAPVHGSAVAGNPWVTQSLANPDAGTGISAGAGAGSWTHYRLPGKKASHFSYELNAGRASMVAAADGSASMLRRVLRVEPAQLGQLQFSWKLPGLIEDADLSVREFDDSALRVVLSFDGDRSRFSAKNAALSEMAQLLTGDELPYATLMYVWCNACPPEAIIQNPRTDRIRKLPLESGPAKLNRWLEYNRDIRSDFEKAFGEAPGALTSVSIMTDTDNTKSRARAYYGPLKLISKPR